MGVLVAISIPIFTNQLEKSREAVDEANVRSLYAETVSAVLAEDTDAKTDIKDATLTVNVDGGVYTGVATLKLSQQKNGLEGGKTSVNIGGIDVPSGQWGANKTMTITVKSDGTKTTITSGT